MTYTYDAWGNPLSTAGSMAGTLGTLNPLRYRGYVYDTETGLYYLQSRYYDPEICRFINADGYASTGQGLLGGNMFAYCLNNPVIRLDEYGNSSNSIWSLKNDAKGRKILWNYLYGEGKPIIKENGSWGRYLRRNKILKEKVQELVFPIGNDLSLNTIQNVNIVTSMENENGEDIIGYQYLHGTNADAGGFSIEGTISKDYQGNITYDLVYTWNDIIDPNFSYESDSKKAAFARRIPFANPTDYLIRISWTDTTVIKENPSLFNQNQGWLK